VRRVVPGIVAAVLLAATAVHAQIPRQMTPSADAKDFNGLWVISNRGARGYLDQDLKALMVAPLLTPFAKAQMAKNTPELDPSAACLPAMPRHMSGPYPIHITQTPAMVTFLFEYETTFRNIYLDDRERPEDEARYMGFALGKWEGDTLVVETTNLNEKAWLQADGTPVTPTTKLTERIRKIEDGKTLEVIMKIEDPAVFTRPVFRQYLYNFKPDWQLSEYYCAEGNRDDPQNQKAGQPGSLGGAKGKRK